MRCYVLLAAALFCARIPAMADLHPIVEIESDYFFGASENGKWVSMQTSSSDDLPLRASENNAAA